MLIISGGQIRNRQVVPGQDTKPGYKQSIIQENHSMKSEIAQ